MRKKSYVESELQRFMMLKLKNEEYLKALLRDAYHFGSVFHLTKYKTEELEEQISEVRRKFQVRVSGSLRVVKRRGKPGLCRRLDFNSVRVC